MHESLATRTYPKELDLTTLQANVDRAATYSQRMWGLLQLLVLRSRGADELNRFKTQILRRHQRAHFLPGLERLGIDRRLPPAVIAARYHYLSNQIGGLEMEYIEESDRKVWIRYLPPCWSFTGISVAAVPSSVQRSMFAGWHPNNGIYLDAPGLRFVVTKVYQDGEPYDEGYFEDVGRRLNSDERLVFRPVAMSPHFDRNAAPLLNPDEWPPTRLALAKRKFAAAYYLDGVETCVERYGVLEAVALMTTAFRIYWTQFLSEMRSVYGIASRSAQEVVELIRRHGVDTADEVDVQSTGSSYKVIRKNRSLVGGEFPEAIHVANAGFVGALVYVSSANIRATLESVRVDTSGSAVEKWLIEDVGARVY